MTDFEPGERLFTVRREPGPNRVIGGRFLSSNSGIVFLQHDQGQILQIPLNMVCKTPHHAMELAMRIKNAL